MNTRVRAYDFRFKVADLTQQGALADHANTRARWLVDRWMGLTEPRPSDSEGDRPEALAVLLALCGREEEGQVLLGELLADSVASGRLEKWDTFVRRDSDGSRATAAISTTERAEEDKQVDRVGSTGMSSDSKREGPEAGVSPGSGPGDTRNAESAATKAPASTTAKSQPSSAMSEVLRQAAQMTADSTVTAAAAGPSAPPIHPRDPIAPATPAAGIVFDSPPVPAVGAAANAGPSDKFTLDSVFDDETDFLERSAAEQAALEDSNISEAGGYFSGFSSSFAPPPPPPSDRRENEQRYRQQQPRSNGQEGRRNEAEKPGTAAAAAAVSPSIIRYADLCNHGHTLVLFDLETTGFDYSNDRVIQLAAKVRERREGGMENCLNPNFSPKTWCFCARRCIAPSFSLSLAADPIRSTHVRRP